MTATQLRSIELGNDHFSVLAGCLMTSYWMSFRALNMADKVLNAILTPRPQRLSAALRISYE